MVVSAPPPGTIPWAPTASDMIDALNDVTTNYATKAYANARNPTALVGNDAVWVRSEGSGSQTMSNTTSTPVAYAVDTNTHAWVTKSAQGAGHKFTVNVTGLWFITAGVRHLNGSAGQAGERYFELRCDRAGFEATVVACGGYSNGLIAQTNTLSYLGAMDAGRYIYAQAWQASGGNLDVENTSRWRFFTLSLIRRYV